MQSLILASDKAQFDRTCRRNFSEAPGRENHALTTPSVLARRGSSP
jgi:hypothetical protein